MDYDVKIVPADHTIVTEKGVFEPMCNSCINTECTNPIQTISISEFGKIKRDRLWVVNNTYRVVVACKGYEGPIRMEAESQ